MHRFYAPVTSFDGETVTLMDSEAHHLRDVLRHAVGDNVSVFDGQGGEFLCVIESMTKKNATLHIVKSVKPAAPESPLDLTVAAAMLKGEKFDLVVKKCVELGVTRLVPLVTARCDVRLKDSEKKQERWQKMAIDAARQCGRATLMHVARPEEFRLFASAGAGVDEVRTLFSERGGESLAGQCLVKKITAFVGPEGGWDDTELEIARERQITIVTFGGRILRAETAVIAVATILQHRFGDIN